MKPDTFLVNVISVSANGSSKISVAALLAHSATVNKQESQPYQLKQQSTQQFVNERMSQIQQAGGQPRTGSVAKPLLQFNVTPPKQNGPSEAERKIEALTRQLEEEMEKEEEQGEYFGNSSHSYSFQPSKCFVLAKVHFVHFKRVDLISFFPQECVRVVAIK